ncbi:MAG: porin [Gemmatimonadota bacterium]
MRALNEGRHIRRRLEARRRGCPRSDLGRPPGVRAWPVVVTCLGVAVAPSMVAGQQVDTELYGNFRYSANAAADGSTSWAAMANNASRLGVRGSVEGGGLTARMDLQTGVDVDGGADGAFTQRYYFVELSGGFGAVAVGRRSTTYKMAGLRLDPFYDTSTISVAGTVPAGGLFAGASFGLSNLTNGFADATVEYTTPQVGGLSVNAAAQVDPASDHDLSAGLVFRRAGVEFGFQHYEARGTRWAQTAGVDAAQRIHASYGNGGRWTLGGSAERVTADAGGENRYLYAVGTMRVVPSVTLVAAAGDVGGEGGLAPVAGTGIHAGVFLDLLPQVRLHALYSHLEADSGPAIRNAALGLSYGFTLAGDR